MQWVTDLLTQQSLLLLFFVATIGHLLGKINFKGISLGVAAVLFVGLGMSAMNHSYVLPQLFGSLGLVIFVYSIGISSGPNFFASLKNGGKRNNGMVAIVLFILACLIFLVYAILDLSPAVAAGLFTGTSTNTAALAGVVQMLSSGNFGEAGVQAASLPAVGYSVAYPMGVLGPILAIAFWQKRFKIDYKRDAELLTDSVAVGKAMYNKTIQITNKECCGTTLKSLAAEHHWGVIFGRVRRGNEEWLATTDNYTLQKGDLVNALGAPEDVDAVIKVLGVPSDKHLEVDLSTYDRRRIIVSSKQIAGRKIRTLHMPQRFGAMITRVKRGDVDMLAHKNFILEYGDRVVVLAPVDKVTEVRRFLGDSYKDVSSINIVGIGIGICLGLIVGSIPIDLPGGMVFRLGDAGGPLVVGLILSMIRRSGSIVWGIPYAANQTLREFGLILMLATIGTRSGHAFITALHSSNGLPIFLAAAGISLLIPFVLLPILYKRFKLPFAMATGMLAAVQTQPAVQSYAEQQSHNDLPNYGYAIVYPTTTVLKIIFAQLILIILL